MKKRKNKYNRVQEMLIDFISISIVIVAVVMVILNIDIEILSSENEMVNSINSIEEKKNKDILSNGYTGEGMGENAYSKYNNVDKGKLIETETVEGNYFEKSVFLGDSRTVAMKELGILEAANTFSVNGINHIDFISQIFLDTVTGITGDIFEIVAARKPDKIYVALGVNGVSFIQKDLFIEKYNELIERLIEASPDSKIIIESILPVNENTYTGSNKNLTNKNIDEMNTELLAISENRGVYFLDISDALKNEENSLAIQYDCGDGLHFTKEGYEAVFEEICKYGID